MQRRRPGSTTLGLEEAHRELKISPAEFDEVAAELGRTLDFFKVPEPEKEEVLAAFAAHKGEVTEGYSDEETTLRTVTLERRVSSARQASRR